MRNCFSQTTIAPYCIRAIEKGPIAMPIDWKDLDRINPQDINLSNYKKFIKINPWKDLAKKAKSIKNIQKSLDNMS